MNDAWIWAIGAASLAGFSRGFAAFGTAMIYIPLMTVAFDARTAVVTLFLIDLVPSVPLVVRAWKAGNRLTLGWMGLGAAALSPVGVAILRFSNREVLELLLGAILLGATSALLFGRGLRFGSGRRVALAAGGASGLAGGICGIFGPAAMIYLLGRAGDARETRANAILFLTGESILLGVTYFVYGMIRPSDFRLSLLLLPLYAGFTWLGARGFSHAAEGSYRKALLVLLWVLAIIMTMNAARGLWAA